MTVNVGALSNALAVAIQQATDGRGEVVNAGSGSVSTPQPSSSVSYTTACEMVAVDGPGGERVAGLIRCHSQPHYVHVHQ